MDSKYQSYIDLIKSKLSPYRFNHSVEVAKSAVYLAEKYGGDSEKMYVAGLLHDVLKEADRDETFYYVDKYVIPLTVLEEVTPKLWHAIVGAEFIRNELGIDDDEIITAVRYHTTGRKNMTLSEKILFIADFISADRDYNGADEMRERAEKSLECAMDMGLSFTIADLVEHGRPVHPDTVDAYNDIKLQE
ncbi:MAG: bis(5'-nucleosyl)-tetraphosphatase (symmetrical) YqeK [Clostridia bacterium]|nr:bis(5'-nucleosyl)-tetraphosphatase (symmetrical) YqeK [Clostridia bacterium]